MNILIGMECSGVVRDAFIAAGHNAMSCDLLETERPGPHYKGDIRDILESGGVSWDIAIYHPDCTYLCSSGLHWNKKRPGRILQTEAALEMVRYLMKPRVHVRAYCVENPVGRIGTAIRKADQYIQPYQFGHDASKRTGLWLYNLPLIVPNPADYVQPRMVDGKPRWANQTDSGQNALAPSDDRWMDRARTYEGIAGAFALNWGL